MPSMASSLLPFSPLPHAESQTESLLRSRNLRPLRLPFSFDASHLVAHDRERTTHCRVLTSEPKGCAAPAVLQEDEMSQDDEEENVASWSRLGRLVLLSTLPEDAAAIDPASEQLLSPAWASTSEDMGDCGLFPPNYNLSAAVQSTPPPRQKQEESEKQDFYVNIGYAIRTLREELPTMFYKDLTYDIYREDIVFRDPLNMVGGLGNYKLIYRALRFHGNIFFKALWVDILWVWQPCDNVIMVRWQVRGIPRVPWEAQGIFDGTSEYKLDKGGKIYEHKVDNVALNARPKFKIPTVADLLRVGACPSTPKPTFFQTTLLVFSVIWPYLLQFTWVRYYLALKGTIGLYRDPHVL